MKEKITLILNEKALKKRYRNIPKAIEIIRKKFETQSSFKKPEISVSFITLKGIHGEIAYLKNFAKDMFDFGKVRLIIEFPLGLGMKLKRDWIKYSSNFYQPHLKQEEEVVEVGDRFTQITKKPFRETSTTCHDDNLRGSVDDASYILVSRSRTYKDKSPYGLKTTSSAFYKKRNQWLKAEYRKLRERKVSETKCYDKIENRLSSLHLSFFGKKCQPKNKKPFNLSTDRIKFIVQSKKNETLHNSFDLLEL